MCILDTGQKTKQSQGKPVMSVVRYVHIEI